MLLVLLACRPGTTGDRTTPEPTETGTVSSPTGETGGTTTEPPPPPTVGSLELSLSSEISLVIFATFPEVEGADEEWVEYRVDGTEGWLQAPLTGPGAATILGIPANTDVEARAVAVTGGSTGYGPSATITTGPLPPALLEPNVLTYDAKRASPEPYAMISVASGSFTYTGPYILEIFDRDGTVVWYHIVPNSLFSFYPTVARDGTHIWFEGENIFGLSGGTPGVTRRTLDGRWSVSWPISGLGQAIAEGPDGSFFYELRTSQHGVWQLDAYGHSTEVWNCSQTMADLGLWGGDCLMNTCNWDESRNTVLASQFETSTVFEIDVATGEVVRQMGQIDQGDPWSFDPPSSMFAYQHDPHWTDAGTLMVSTHAPCQGAPGCDENFGQDGIQRASEYTVDDATHTLHLVSSYVSTDRWATQCGEAFGLANGDLIQGYGQDGAVREVTPDGAIVWEVAWPKDNSGYRVVGHTSLVEDLYTLNQGP